MLAQANAVRWVARQGNVDSNELDGLRSSKRSLAKSSSRVKTSGRPCLGTRSRLVL